MALNIKINLGDCYELEDVSNDLSSSKFVTTLSDDSEVEIGVLIGNTSHTLLTEVYNLAFGPVDKNNAINDTAKLTHKDHSKTFSTIVLASLTFLSANPDKYLGIDGSNNARAYLYFRIIQNNYDQLSQYFEISGVNYYVRILRKTKDTDSSHPVDSNDMEAIPRPIQKGEKISSDKMYNYFIFKLKEGVQLP
ncbi:hypothetical protein SAMN04488029_0128 [Reichenbachiella faecimaris]|uniref:Uncharacterized protein n=1 Tax=Reichenbachiella faecimaris TaxID=692418 RepID=A0A1W2G5C4_REIFA|nr:hypothetical protein [Reichenbachiella faecimaris]SMD31791.1 hypothetical protein SAMN04488029_0128 [Reichenbachiella faecimaris]